MTAETRNAVCVTGGTVVAKRDRLYVSQHILAQIEGSISSQSHCCKGPSVVVQRTDVNNVNIFASIGSNHSTGPAPRNRDNQEPVLARRAGKHISRRSQP